MATIPPLTVLTHKDIPTLLRAIRIAADGGVPLRCLLIGRGLGHGDEELAAAIRNAGCEELVVPLGPRSDIPTLARALDLLRPSWGPKAG